MTAFKNKFLPFFMIIFIISSINATEKNYIPAKQNLEARTWFQDAKFGLFVHWGVYCLLGDGEWVMQQQTIPLKNYEKLPAFFNPIEFNPAEWFQMAKDAGMKYITITSKHHDGFAMFDSKVSDWDIVDRTPYQKDVIKMLADECHKQGIKLFFYYSQLDWHHPDYFPRGRTGTQLGRPESGEWKVYLKYQNDQLAELLTNYGPIGGIWFDGWWDKKWDKAWDLETTYELIHKLQPATMIGNNHHVLPFPGEDFQMFEKDLPGRNTAGFNEDSKVGDLPLETCETMNRSWGFALQDNRYKSTKELVQYLVKAAGNNANFLLNVGPMPNGKIQPEFVQTLQEMGQWMRKYGESIYGTRGGPVSQHNWGVSTQKGKQVYLHILAPEDEQIYIPLLQKVKSATFFEDKSKAEFSPTRSGYLLTVPTAKRQEFDTIVILEMK